jgi:hypothetical protein
MRIRVSWLGVLVALLCASPVFGWHKDGHMAIARMAWLKMSDKEKAAASKILMAHPHHQVFLITERPDAIPEIEWAFARAAAWPDWVRDAKQQTPGLTAGESAKIKADYHNGPWHFVNLPFIHPDDVKAKFFDLVKLRKDVLVPEVGPVKGKKGPQPRHAIGALKKNLKVLGDTEAAAPDRAVALWWVLHLVGDLHQPLHCSALLARAKTLPKSTFDPAPSFDAASRSASKRP